MGNGSIPTVNRRNYLKLAAIPLAGISGVASGNRRTSMAKSTEPTSTEVSADEEKPELLASFPFDAGTGTEVVESISDTTYGVTHKPWEDPFWISGVEDDSLVFEGYATNLRARSDPIPTLKPLPGRFKQYHAIDNGRAGIDNGELTIVAGTNTDVWETVDMYSSIYVEEGTKEESTITTRVVSQENTSGFAKGGIVVRNQIPKRGASLGYVNVLVTPSHGYSMQWDDNANGTSGGGSPIETANSEYPSWIRLEKSGTTFTGLYSHDGESWHEMAMTELPNANAVQDVGLFATSLNPIARSRVEFDHFTIKNH